MRKLSANRPNQKGASLIEIMVAIGIMTVIAAGMAQMMSSQFKSSRNINAQLASLDLQRIISQSLSDGTVCNYIFTDTANTSGLSQTPPAVTFEVPASYPALSLLNLNKIPMSASATSVAAAEVGQTISANSNDVRVASIAIDITGAGAPTATSQQFTANLVVGLNTPEEVIPLKPLSFPITIQTTLAGSTANVIGCSSAGAITPQICAGVGGTYNIGANPPCNVPPPCALRSLQGKTATCAASNSLGNTWGNITVSVDIPNCRYTWTIQNGCSYFAAYYSPVNNGAGQGPNASYSWQCPVGFMWNVNTYLSITPTGVSCSNDYGGAYGGATGYGTWN